MKLPRIMKSAFRVPKLTRMRVGLALGVAVLADSIQLLLGPLGWAFGDQIIDVMAMALTSWLLGFHWLLLPTFAIEFVPVLEDMPTWTACVVAVIALRKREQRIAVPPKHTIDV